MAQYFRTIFDLPLLEINLKIGMLRDAIRYILLKRTKQLKICKKKNNNNVF